MGDVIGYSEVVWNGSHSKVTLVDPEYGEWDIYPYNRLRGQCHPMRRKSRISSKKSMTQDEFIKRANAVHKGEGLDYSKVVYENMHKKVCIVDPDYGEYWQEPCVHLKGCGHPMRGVAKQAESQAYTTESFIDKAISVWGDEYDFSKVNYVRSQEKVCVICKKHGEFMAYPDALLQGKGCPHCGNHRSDGEDWLYGLCCKIVGKDNVIRQDRSLLGDLELDIFIPSMDIAFEFDGLRWHSELFGKDNDYHLSKTLKCAEHGVTLIHIFEDEWVNKRKILETKILTLLGGRNSAQRIGARKCSIELITTSEAKAFLNNNHIQGWASSSVYVGALFGGRIVGVMAFKKCEDRCWELNRFATDKGCIVQGLASKLFKWFISEYNPTEVKSFLDRRWGVDGNNVYNILGFELNEVIRPSYWYTDGHGVRYHKFGFRKQILHKKYGLPLSMTELEMTKKLGYTRIWDCGLFKYVWRRDNEDIISETVVEGDGNDASSSQ